MQHDLSKRMLIGINAAHSRSSSTYVRLGQVLDHAAVRTTDRLSFTVAAIPSTFVAPLQATIERAGRRAGLLGAIFTPDQTGSTLCVGVAVAQDNPNELFARGLEVTHAQTVLDAIKAIVSTLTVTELGAGYLDVA